MYHAKINWTAVVGIAFVLAIVVNVALFAPRFFKNEDDKAVKPLKEVFEKAADRRHEYEDVYTIDALTKRDYVGSQIALTEKIADEETYTTYIFAYVSDGLTVHGLASIPKTEKPEGGYPVLILNHGYINPDVYSTKNSYRSIFDFFALQGHIVLKPDYRGHAQSEGDGEEPLNRILYAVDVVNLIESVSSLVDANPEKIVMWGHSMGGNVTLRVLEITDKVKGGSLWAPVSAPFPESLMYFIQKHRPQSTESAMTRIKDVIADEQYASVSVLDNLDRIRVPLLIHHGTSDESVPYEWSVRLDSRLKKTDNTYTFHTYEGDDHNFTNGSRPTVLQRDVEFFRKVLDVTAE